MQFWGLSILLDERGVKVWDAQSFPTLSDPKDCSPPGSSVHGVLQARTLEWVAISCSRGSSQPRDQTQVSGTAGRLFTIWATREAHCLHQTSFLDGFSKTQGPFQSQRLCPPVSLPKMTFLYEWYILFSLDLNATCPRDFSWPISHSCYHSMFSHCLIILQNLHHYLIL